jgi:hypothetical protein
VIPHDIDPKRFQSLLGYGLDGDSLMQFFRESKAALVGAAVKVDNLPPNPSAARKVITGFNARAHLIFAKWITARPRAVTGIATPDELVARLRAIELGEEEIDEEDQKALHAVGLREFYAEKPAALWIEFLRTPMGGGSKDSTGLSPAEWTALTAWWLGSGPRPTEGALAAAVTSLRVAIDQRDPDLLSEMPAFNGATEELRSLIERRSGVEEPLTAPDRGVIAAGPPQQQYDPNIDYTQLAVIANNRSPKLTEPFFVAAEAFIDDSGGIFSLSPADMKRAVPRDGRIVLHKDRGFPSAPTIGESFVYEVQEYETDLPVKVKAVDSIPDRLFRVIHIPVTSKEAHKIRDAIVQYARAPGARLAIFVTLDKACLRPRGDTIQGVLGNNFDWQLERWDSLKAIELANGAYVVAPLPSTAKGLDCSPLSSAARRLLKLFSQRSDIKLAKAQRDVLQELVSSDELNFEDSTHERLLSNINAIDRGAEDFESLVKDLLQSSSIKTDIEKRVTEKIDTLAAERARELQSIESLKREKANLERGIERLRDEADKKAKAVRNAIQKAFANTSSKELESLGQIAVFDALMSRRQEPSQGAPREAESPQRIYWGPLINPSKRPIAELFREFGLKAAMATRVENATRLAVRLGLPLVAAGAGAFHVGTQLAAALCAESCLVGDVVIGLLDSPNIANRLTEPGVDTMLLRNANLSDLSVYASDLLSLIFQQSMEKAPSAKRAKVILTTVTGAAALPMPQEIGQLAVSLDLMTIEAVLTDDSRHSENAARNVFWRRLVAKVEEIESGDPDVSQTFADLQKLMNAASV